VWVRRALEYSKPYGLAMGLIDSCEIERWSQLSGSLQATLTLMEKPVSSGIKRDDLLKLVGASLPPEYKLVNRLGEAEATHPAPIGSGGSSVVFRSLYRERLPRAIKVVIPRDDLREALDLNRFLESFRNEVSQLAKLSHEHIAKITDFAAVELAGEEYPFIATEYVEGVQLSCFAESATGAEIFAALQDVLEALDYMHRSGVMHCDLKPDNILIRRDVHSGSASAVVVDLGASRFFGPADDTDRERELVYFYSTAAYVHPGLKLVLSNWTANRISRANLRSYFPLQDLHSFGVILQELLSDSAVQQKLSDGLGRQYVRALQDVSSRLTSGATFESAREVADALLRIAPTSVSVFGVPELSLVPSRGVIIPALGARGSTSPRMSRLVSHPFFQRLHQLPQLDLLQYVLPGATHSRFVHALHTYELVREALLHLLGDWKFRLEVSTTDIEATLVAAITSQLGHYHFLHMFEDFIAAAQTDPRIQAAKLLTDIELLDTVMGRNETDLGKKLGSILDSDGRNISDAVHEFGLDWEMVRTRMERPSSPLQGVLAGLLSSPVDAEKLSYLYDDSAATGIPFGRSVTGGPIFDSMLVPHFAQWSALTEPVAIAIRERGMSYLEHGVLARYWNIQTAYWNRTNRSVQAMIKFLIKELILAGELEFELYIAETIHLSSDGALRWLNDRFVRAQGLGKIRQSIVNPVSPLLGSERAIYKRLITISGQSRIPGREPDHKIFEQVRSVSPLDDGKVLKTVKRSLDDVLPGMNIQDGELLLDLPRPRREEAGGAVLVYTDDGEGYMGDLFAISPFLENHKQSFELYVKRMRVFIHPRIYDALEQGGLLKRAYDSCLNTLRKEWAK